MYIRKLELLKADKIKESKLFSDVIRPIDEVVCCEVVG